jgi:hypothetical protein
MWSGEAMNAPWLALGAFAIVVLSLVAGFCAGFSKERRAAPVPSVIYCTRTSTDEICLRAQKRFERGEGSLATAPEPSAAAVH